MALHQLKTSQYSVVRTSFVDCCTEISPLFNFISDVDTNNVFPSAQERKKCPEIRFLRLPHYRVEFRVVSDAARLRNTEWNLWTVQRERSLSFASADRAGGLSVDKIFRGEK